uniref:AlNc14C252G9659 protein n=1 Tax=Albugo laibachii Nc14 TaxID=890382 RepID=F0WTH9_9STRA|nr:AlNc14C252G9659 [Albugo laibachii Nc14]|eukprot:CCA24670.1 AlNc14C252G9659 [Albugo laibachii Nc14]
MIMSKILIIWEYEFKESIHIQACCIGSTMWSVNRKIMRKEALFDSSIAVCLSKVMKESIEELEARHSIYTRM